MGQIKVKKNVGGIEGLCIIEPTLHGDSRGYFMETYNKNDMAESEKYGYYHATNEGGYISWYDFTKEIFRQAVALGHTEYDENHVTVFPVTTAEYGMSKAARPFNSRLDKSKLIEAGFTPLPDWKDALQRYLKNIL